MKTRSVMHYMSDWWIYLSRPRKVLLVLGKSISKPFVRIWFQRVNSKVAWNDKLFKTVSCPLGPLGANVVSFKDKSYFGYLSGQIWLQGVVINAPGSLFIYYLVRCERIQVKVEICKIVMP